MDDENINEYEDLSIRISELPETSNVDNEDDYLILSHPTTASTSDYLTYKIHPNQLASQGVTYTAGDHININSSNVISATYDVATSSDPGLMSTSDKTKLDGIESGANNYELPIASASDLGGVKVGSGLSINVEGALSADTIPEATTTTAGLMSSSDKSKLDGVATNANNYVLPTASDTTLGGVKVGSGLSINDDILSTDPIPDATTSASGLMSATDKTKLNGLSPYTLPAATTSSLGGVKVGSGLSIDTTGELSVDQYQLPIASSSTLGGVKIGSGISIASDGTISTTGGGGGSSTLSGLQDVDIQSPQPDQVLKYDSTNNKWINASGGGGGSSSLAGLSDVTISTPGSNQALLYDTGSASWHNAGIDYSNITNTPTLATVATSGAYADLSGTPTLATVAITGAYSDLSGTPTLAAVATSGDYTDLSNTPTIPAAQVNSDWNSSSGVSEILNKPTLATVATTGAYSDLSGTPTIPDGLADLTDDVNISSPTDGQILKYDGTSSKWVNGTGGGGGASALDDLTDVDITTPSDGQTLVYDGTNSKWINGAGSGGGSAKQTAVTQAQYNALIQAGTVDQTMEYFITDGIPSSVEYYHNYSTTEHIVGSWLDGSIIYEKTYTTDFVQGSTYVDIDVSNENIDTIFSCEGLLKASPEESIQQMVVIPYGASNLIYINIISTHDGYVRINRQQGHFYGNTPTIWITIRYSKSST